MVDLKTLAPSEMARMLGKPEGEVGRAVGDMMYRANSNITAVLDTDGRILESHTYDVLRRGLTSSRANGVDAVTVTYPQ